LEEDARGPNVRIPPPFLFALPLLTGFLVQHFVPIRIVSGVDPERIIRLVGWAEIAIALTLMGWAIGTFRRLQTPIVPIRRARSLVDEGPFALTRNPMYLGFTVLYLGISFVANALWPLAIRLEEAYLTREFGEEYTGYCARVRRWL
jgi:protein-S-isoprenylcysteine O-methyltransferase Ste14